MGWAAIIIFIKGLREMGRAVFWTFSNLSGTMKNSTRLFCSLMGRSIRILFWKITLMALLSVIIEFIPLTPVHADPVIYTLSGIVSVPDVWNSSGNAGSIWFYATTNPTFHPYIDTDGTLHGSFWSHNLGWVNFNHMVWTVPAPYMTCPINILSG